MSSTILPPRAQLCNRSCSNKHTHTELVTLFVRDGQTSSHWPRLVVSRSTCPPLSPPPANSFVIGTAVINTHTELLLKISKVIDNFNRDVALHRAVEEQAYAKILFLVNAGANVNSKVYGGKSFPNLGQWAHQL